MRIVRAIGGFFRFWYGFIVGDDWTVAAAIGAALLVTNALNHNGIAAWWVVPLTVVIAVGSSLRRTSSVVPAPIKSDAAPNPTEIRS